jgi:hypothetical protein
MATEHLKAIAELEGDMREQIEEIGDEASRTGKKAKKAFDQIDKDAREASKSIGASVKEIGAVAAKVFAAVGAATTVAGVAMSKAAADAEELESKFNALFDDSADRARAWGETFRAAVGRGAIETRQALADMRGFTEGLKLSGDEADELSFKLTQMAVDLSSFYNVEQEDAAQRLRSGLIGNAEALDAFAARISEAQLKEFAEETGVLYNELTDTEKVLLRLELLQNKVNKAMGDAERTSGSFTNQMRALKGGLEDATAEFGVLVNEGISQAITELGGPDKLIELFRVGAATAAEMSVALVELAQGGLQNAIGAINELGGSEAAILRLQIRFLELKTAVGDILAPLNDLGKTLVQNHRDFEQSMDELDAYMAEQERELLEKYRPDKLDLFDKMRGQQELLSQSTDKLIAKREALLATLEKEERALAATIDFNKANFESLGDLSDEQIASWQGQNEAVRLARQALADYDAQVDPAIVKLSRLRQELEALESKGGETPNPFADLDQPAEPFSVSADVVPGKVGPIDSVEATDAIASGLTTLKANAEAALGALADVRDQIFGGGAGGDGEDIADGSGEFLAGFNDAVASSEMFFTRFSQAVADGSMSAGEAFENFGKMFLKQAAAMIIKAQILRALGISFDGGQMASTGTGLSGALGFGAKQANGGILQGAAMANGGVLPFNAYASGGIATGPQLALMGENPFYSGEAFVPLPDGKRIPVEGGGMGGGVTFQVQAVDSASFRDRVIQDKELYIGLIREAMIRDRSFREVVGSAR